MSTRSPHIRLSFVVLLLTASPAAQALSQSQAASPTATSSSPRDAQLGSRLTQLDPARPREYFELAEEVADLAQRTSNVTPSPDSDSGTASGSSGSILSIRLARELSVIAFEIWRSQPASARIRDPRLGPSCLLLLASIAENPDRARWLRAMAAAIDTEARLNADMLSPVAPGPALDATVLELVSALELLRGGEGRRAARLLDRVAVKELLDRYQILLSPSGITGESERIRRLADEWAICPECRNRRFTRSTGGISLCSTCRGDPGPPLTSTEVLYQLRLEAALLEGVQKSWVAQTLVDGGRPLRDLDPEEVAPSTGVDPALRLWREGRWVPLPAPPKAPSSTPAGTPVLPADTAPAATPAPTNELAQPGASRRDGS